MGADILNFDRVFYLAVTGQRQGPMGSSPRYILQLILNGADQPLQIKPNFNYIVYLYNLLCWRLAYTLIKLIHKFRIANRL